MVLKLVRIASWAGQRAGTDGWGTSTERMTQGQVRAWVAWDALRKHAKPRRRKRNWKRHGDSAGRLAPGQRRRLARRAAWCAWSGGFDRVEGRQAEAKFVECGSVAVCASARARHRPAVAEDRGPGNALHGQLTDMTLAGRGESETVCSFLPISGRLGVRTQSQGLSTGVWPGGDRAIFGLRDAARLRNTLSACVNLIQPCPVFASPATPRQGICHARPAPASG